MFSVLLAHVIQENKQNAWKCMLKPGLIGALLAKNCDQCSTSSSASGPTLFSLSVSEFGPCQVVQVY